MDSGNLAGHLLTLRPGLLALGDAPILDPRWIEGVSDAFAVLADAAGSDPPAAVVRFQEALEGAIAARAATLADAWLAGRSDRRVRGRCGGLLPGERRHRRAE